MKFQLAHISLIIDDYDRAIDYYTQTLGFTLTEDKPISSTKRWVLVTPAGSSCSLLLAKAADAEQISRIGNQTGGRVFLFLHTDNFDEYYARLKASQVEFIKSVSEEPHGKVAVFRDFYGNLWDLIEAKTH